MKSEVFRFGIVFIISIFFLKDVDAQIFRYNFPNCICAKARITSQPVSPAPVCPNSSVVTFSVTATGTGPLIYKWKENGVLLSNGGMYNGTSSNTLTITNPTAALDGKIYQCKVINCNSYSVVSNPDATLIIYTNATDLNQDGMTDNQDFSQLNLIYNSVCLNCREDINSDGTVDVKDFLRLLGAFNTSCQ